eukprot:4501688-Alexandrium_andersonii.AAC.1
MKDSKPEVAARGLQHFGKLAQAQNPIGHRAQRCSFGVDCRNTRVDIILCLLEGLRRELRND